MPKIKPHRTGLKEYVRLAELPGRQAGDLLDWLPETYFTKVEGEEIMHDDCVDYEDYEFWFEHCYQSQPDFPEEQI